MRVLVNCQSVSAQKTGVGHYTEQLVTHLDALGTCDFTRFPTQSWRRWEHRLHGCYKFARAVIRTCRLGGKSADSIHFGDSSGGLAEKLRAVRARLLERSIAYQMRRCRVDVYHEPNHVPLACSVPTVTTFHDVAGIVHPEWHPPHRARWYEANLERTLAQTTHFIAVSDFTRNQLIDVVGVAPERVTRVYNGIRTECKPVGPEAVAAVLARLKLPAHYLLYVGIIEPRKNLVRLMQAYCALPESLRRECPLIMAGRWGWQCAQEHEYYTNFARHQGVIHVGYVADADLPALYCGARALVYPSHYEGFGLPVVEMLACGGAVLASTAGALVEIANNCAHFVDAQDTDGWREALQRVLRDDDWWKQLRSKSATNLERYSWERCAMETAQVYRRVAGAATNGDVSNPNKQGSREQAA
jgi:alpha-1,3-rhamnosyl/mannosyltransferase